MIRLNECPDEINPGEFHVPRLLSYRLSICARRDILIGRSSVFYACQNMSKLLLHFTRFKVDILGVGYAREFD